jgi:hypothetical protein
MATRTTRISAEKQRDAQKKIAKIRVVRAAINPTARKAPIPPKTTFFNIQKEFLS